ncbi:MAG: hypothetical protein KA952_08035 [Sediminibacterium sp.]|nr:hypothetical protein [Sediminibacterium sp.]
MPIYRFMNKDRVQCFLNGNLRPGNARFYRLLEIVTDNQSIGDKSESKVVANTGPISITPEERDAKTLDMLQTQHIAYLEENVTFKVFGGVEIIKSKECYILSFCIGELENFIPIMTDPSQVGYCYDACVELLDANAFCKDLENCQINGSIAFNEVFSHCEHGKVQYTGQNTDVWESEIQVNPFLKSSTYSKQSEYRFLLYPYKDKKIYDDHLHISVPNTLEHFREIPLNIPINNTNCTINPYSTVTNGELVKILDECSQLIKQQLSHDRSERFQTFENVITTSTKTVTITAPSLHGDYFTHDCLKRGLKAYWELRKRGYRSILMDSNLDSIGLQSLDHCLSIYLYGSAMKFDTPPLSSNFSKGETHNTGVYYGLINCTKCS